ncbi:HlyD family efflux transporter periplasmic adaptor subunit [Bailinhaonella thermotolerans]|uniref:HlyD family efflux transporter periplasmic adaptor subunit n=1 Tax=Bailinhaonella thermotolerans TaxID=1070861 RepID=A0A3A4AVS4_9ACTN|nr:HlyD family efflux transporter periplasmic adaptor subunit [Bailinhaonella thermotolerans]
MLIGGLAAAALIAGGGIAFAALGDPGEAPASTKAAAGSTAPVTRGDLVDTRSVSGTLTYTAERGITTGAAGTVTAVPKPGSIVRQGRPLLKVDRKPVVLLYGELPLYRELRQGVSKGPDVRQLETALKALGYGEGMTVDKEFTWQTARAVREWQKRNGLERTGAVDSAQAVFLPGPVRVAEPKVATGDRLAAGQRILTVTGTTRIVHVDLDAEDQRLVKRGDKVSVELPGGQRATGRVSSVGTVAKQEKSEGGGGPGGSGKTTVDVEIRLSGKTGRLDQAPVTVTLESERRENVLSVPVEALLALREGGFGVELVEANGTRRIVGVETGAYGGGRVEVTGGGLEAGMNVGVPAK